MDVRVKPAYDDLLVASAPQTNWSIRVPCPGGSGGRTVGAAAPASSALLLLAASGALGVLVSGGLTGAGAAILETLIGKILKIVAPDCDGAKNNVS
jgi:riboflavin biosynthesis pyrimidine reductase